MAMTTSTTLPQSTLEGWDFFIGCVIKWYNSLFYRLVAGFEINDLEPDIFAVFLFVEQSFHHRLVFVFAVEQHAALRVFGPDASVDADTRATGDVADEWQQGVEARRERDRDRIDQCRNEAVGVL